MKKILSLILAMTLSLSLFVVSVTAELPEIRVILDGEQIEFDVPPQIIDNRTMVPMRAIFEALGATVFWHYDEEAIADEIEEIIRENETHGIPNAEIFDWVAYRPVIQAFDRYSGVLLQIASSAMLVMGADILDDRWVELDVPPQIVDNRTLVPVRAISEGLNAEVEWCGDTRTVTITT